MPPGAASEIDESEFSRIESIIQSMTRQEKQDPNVLVREPKRVQRVARGSGRDPSAISDLVREGSSSCSR